jgi:hypothetical protein
MFKPEFNTNIVLVVLTGEDVHTTDDDILDIMVGNKERGRETGIASKHFKLLI